MTTLVLQRRPAPAPLQTLFGVPAGLLLLFVIYLATVDTFMTHSFLSRGLGRELNPVMDWLYHAGGAAVFATCKVGLTALCMVWVRHRAPPACGRLAALAALAIYLPLTGVHIVHMYGYGAA